ncbi:pyridoxal-phosphate-dependent aminotransferase family protein [Pseudothauera rhizosphaerae]|uniref:Alanine--glyoxylate aminotransferase family protein n=1 Tax=Pseudothauera rhizosphaerae TaxID=2565932 RepID=A0A4S4AQB4_9RHOO|nr:alanine--glyoxylate aminotransferase family protein [Pseudothauera rhizosphaerae]THF60634.1 alanine--glyoxylate aminotransferase family protein [Pseudothauera rhizosphaerae]
MNAISTVPERAIDAFHPPRRILLGPGPSDLHPRVMAALGQGVIGYLDPVFVGMMEELKTLLRYAFQTANPLTFPLSGPGSVGMETCFVNLVEPGDKVVVCRNGVFGGRMIENVERSGGRAVIVEEEWGRPIDPQKLEDALRAHPDARIVAFVHAETSTGAQSDAATLCRIAREHGCLTIVDAVTSLGGTPVKVDEWGADATYSASQKCLSCTPGLAPVTFSTAAIDKVRARKTKVQSWFMDLTLVLDYWGATQRTYHHTAPGNSLYGLHEALRLLAEEGLENAWSRHRHHHHALKAGLEALGLEFIVPEAARLPQMNAVRVPAGVDDLTVRRALLQDHAVEIGAGLGPLAGKVWRVGLMGYSAREENVFAALGALEQVLSQAGHKTVPGATAAAAAAHRAYAEQHLITAG